ncbi:hypothetical protein ZTR_09310 [Talaromyces verruculosus]|nr:hypothetical protein ZTR_09310 [Talaromyces verruculosus]
MLQQQPGKFSSYYPHEYKNREGPKDAPYPIFDDMETRNEKLYEYPIKKSSERPFDYDAKASKPNKTRQGIVYQKTQKGQKAKPVDLAKPPNECDPVRAVTNQEKHLIGIMYHPQGDMQAFEKASLGALDRQGREDLRLRAYHTTHVSRSSTIPYESW